MFLDKLKSLVVDWDTTIADWDTSRGTTFTSMFSGLDSSEVIILDVTDVVNTWLVALDSLIGDYSEIDAFKLYNRNEDTLFFDSVDENDKFLIEDYLEKTYIDPLDRYVEGLGYEIQRVLSADIHTTPENQMVVNLILKVTNYIQIEV